jgi:hypothetical protein
MERLTLFFVRPALPSVLETARSLASSPVGLMKDRNVHSSHLRQRLFAESIMSDTGGRGKAKAVGTAVSFAKRRARDCRAEAIRSEVGRAHNGSGRQRGWWAFENAMRESLSCHPWAMSVPLALA